MLDAPPSSIAVWFSEPVEPVGGGLMVLAPSGQRVERGPARADGANLEVDLDAVEQGTYLVAWRVVSADTHPARGSFGFSVGRTSSPPPAPWAATNEVGAVSPLGLGLQAAARWLHFVGYALGFGVLTFRLLVLRPLTLADDESIADWLGLLVNLGILMLLLAEPLALLAQAGSLDPAGMFDPEVVSGAVESSFGRVLAQRLAAAVLLWVLLGAAAEASGWVAWTIPGLGLALALVDGQAAHASGVRPLWLGLATNGLHVAAMGTWVGGLAALLVIWRLPEIAPKRAELAARFGRLAAASLGALVVSGGLMALQHLTLAASDLETAYARALAAKLAVLLVALVLALAATRRAGAGRERWLRLEAGALLALLGLAGVLVSLPPPL